MGVDLPSLRCCAIIHIMSYDTITPLSLATIDRLLPAPTETIQDIEVRYPARTLPEGAEVTRIAPSPTGYIHIGVMYTSLICERIAHRSSGVFYLRIEDTDRKREVEGAGSFICSALTQLGIHPDEGPTADGTEVGNYGPYTQSHRQPIYHAYIRRLLEEGKAYPCFFSPEELEAMTARQQAEKVRPGYYGEWAAWRNRSETEVIDALDSKLPYVIRFRSEGDITRRIQVNDAIRGTLELPESDNDIVIMKQDGFPTYHLAHVIDDHLMHTTIAVRGDEWLPSTTLHVQLGNALDLAPLTYAHIAPIQKMDGSSRRKLSKRKDPEASVAYYFEKGYLPIPLTEYLLNQANSSFEEWRVAHPSTPTDDFPFDVSQMAKSGALFNINKLDDISGNYLATLSPEAFYDKLVTWSKVYDPSFHAAMTTQKEYMLHILAIERDGNNRRKDIRHLSEAPIGYGYFFDGLFAKNKLDERTTEQLGNISPEDRTAIITNFLDTYDPEDTNDEWFAKVKKVGEQLGFTSSMKDYRKHPEDFKGSVADVAMILRVALTGRNRSPNLCEVMQVMGVERITQRLEAFSRAA